MCDVAERLEKMGIAKGIEIGRSEGKMEGEIKGKMLVYKNCAGKVSVKKKPEDLRSYRKI